MKPFNLWKAELLNIASKENGITPDQVAIDEAMAIVWYNEKLTPHEAYTQNFAK